MIVPWRFLFAASVALAIAWGTEQALAQQAGAVTTSAEQKLEAALNQPAEWDFVNMPLDELVEWLRVGYHIPVVLQRQALHDVGFSPTTPITLRVRGVTLETALDMLGRKYAFAWAVHGGALILTTPEDMEDTLITKVYPVDEIFQLTLEQVASVFRELPSGQTGEDGRGSEVTGSTISVYEHALNDYTLPDGAYSCDPDEFIDVIQTTIEPTTWTNSSIIPLDLPNCKVLVISQSYSVHRKLARLFEDLRAVSKAKQPQKPAGKGSFR